MGQNPVRKLYGRSPLLAVNLQLEQTDAGVLHMTLVCLEAYEAARWVEI